MESRFINRYHTFCKCLNNLEKVKLPARMQMLKCEISLRMIMMEVLHARCLRIL